MTLSSELRTSHCVLYFLFYKNITYCLYIMCESMFERLVHKICYKENF
jgi:hypothetical protein